MRLKADLVLLLVAALWGSAFVAQRAAGLLGSVYVFNAMRFLLAGALLLPFVLRSRLRRGQLWWMCAAGTVLFLASALQQAGIRSTSAGNAGFLTSLYVVLVPIILFLVWRERLQPRSIVAVGLAAIGAYLLSAAGPMGMNAGDLLQLGGAGLWALHVVLLGKFAFRYDAVAFSAGQLLIGGTLNWAGSAILEPPTFPLPPTLVHAILYTAVVSLGLGYTLQIWGQRHTPPADAALILSLESVFAALGGAIILKERYAPIQIVGCAVIIIAVLLSQVRASSKISVTTDGLQRTSGEP